MKLISPTFHGIIDYLFVIFLAASPILFKMDGNLATFTYALAGVHLLLTILTGFPMGLIKVIPFPLHGLIELLVALALIGVSMYFNHIGDMLGFYFYIWLAVAILLIFFLTDFGLRRNRSN
jgi:hypothetical protein